jgi:hypothetical protein
VLDSLSIVGSVLSAANNQFSSSNSTSTIANVASQVSASILACGRGLLIGSTAGQNPLVIQTSNIAIVAARQTSSSLTSTGASFSASTSAANASTAGASLPSSMLADAGFTSVSNIDVLFSVNQQNPFNFASNGSETNSPVVSMSIFNSDSGTKLHISNLLKPVLITIPHGTLSANESTGCRFWDVSAQSWSTSGCSVSSVGTLYTVCACTHLTDFNAFLTPPIRAITVQDIRNFFNWSSILAHPTTLIFCISMCALWIVMAAVVAKSERAGACICCAPNLNESDEDDEKIHVVTHGGCLKALCDRSQFQFHMSNQTMRSAFVKSILEDARTAGESDMLKYRKKSKCCGFFRDNRIRTAIRANFWGMFLQQHPVFGIWFHDPHDFLTSLQRLAVFVANAFTSLAVGAMFYGVSETTINVEVIGLYTALICAPVSTYFPWAFSRAATQLQDEIDEDSIFNRLNLVRRSGGRILSQCSGLLISTYVLLFLWIFAAIFICLVYGMQFDLYDKSSSVLPTSSLWLYSTIESLVISIFVFLPGMIVLRILFHANLAYRRLQQDQEDHFNAQELALVEASDLDLEHIDDDTYISWLHRALVWVPAFGDDIEFHEKRLDVKSAGTESPYLRVKRVTKSVALVMLQSLVVGVLGGGAFVPLDAAAPSLEDELQFKAVSRVSLPEMRAKSHSIEFSTSDPEVQHRFGYKACFSWLRQNPKFRKHSVEAVKALIELRQAWFQVHNSTLNHESIEH